MPLLISFFFRLLVLAAALVAVALLACVLAIGLAFWALRALWARLTGRPVTPFVVRMGPRDVFGGMMRRAAQAAPQASRTPRTDAAVGPRGSLADVTDVRPK